MKKVTFKIYAACVLLVLFVSGCQKGNLTDNPNAGNANSVVPVSLILNHITANFIRTADEMPFGSSNYIAYKAGQMQVSNYDKYWGNNEDSWSYSAHSYEILKYAIQLEAQAQSQFGANSKYLALAKFFRAYSAIWLSQRVGDIPMSQAGDPTKFPQPVFDTQKDVYKNSLALLEDANTIMNATTNAQPGVVFDKGDIFGLTNLQWRKLINTYRLRVLINLSKRADDNADLNIKTQFAAIVGNPTTYPIMTANSDNMVYKFVASNQYPPFATGNNSYNNFQNVGKTVLDITTSTKDPRTYLMATPVANATNIAAFSSYVGADPGTALATLQNTAGNYSGFNGARYFGSNLGATAEPFIFIGYPEMCFNIAEAVNRGWVPSLSATDAKSWYDKGITASFANFGLNTANATSTVTVSDVGGKSLGTVTVNNTDFLTNVTYNVANPTTALGQILQQKYVAFFMNSGWEAFMNYRRTGLPTFSQGGVGINTGSKLPRRWLYPLDEINNNNSNYLNAVKAQFGGSETIAQDTWLTK